MKKALGALVMVAGLVVVTGCARSERWTLDGSKPGPLNDQKGYKPEVNVSKTARTSGAGTVRNDIHSAQELVTENDYAVVRNKDGVPVVARVQVTPGPKNTAREAVHEIQVSVPAESEVRVGRMTGVGDDTWTYRLVRVERQ